MCIRDSYITNDGAVTRPETGNVTVTLTATVTETATGETETKDYTLTLYSLRQTETENALNAVANALTGRLAPVYGTDTNPVSYTHLDVYKRQDPCCGYPAIGSA